MFKKTCNVQKKKLHSPAYRAGYAGCDHPSILALLNFQLFFNSSYYMAESTSGQDDANPVFRLATRAGKEGTSCPLGISRVGPTKKTIFNKCIHTCYKCFF